MAAAAEFEEEHHGDRSFVGREIRDGLGYAVVEDAEILFLKTRDDIAMLRGGDNIERDDRNVNGDGDTGLGSLLSRIGRLGRIRILLLLRWRRSAALRPGGGLGKGGILPRRQNQNGRKNCEQNYGKYGLHRALPDNDQKLQIVDSARPQETLAATNRVRLSNLTAMPNPRADTGM